MKRKESQFTPGSYRDVVVEVRCDLCQKLAPQPGAPWHHGSFDVTAVTIEYKTGENYPEGGSGELLAFDVCPDCFNGKLLPWFASQGVQPRREDWDW